MQKLSRRVSRRNWLKGALAIGATGVLPKVSIGTARAQASTQLDPAQIRQFHAPLLNPLDPKLPGVRFPASGSAVTLSINETSQTLGVLQDGSALRSTVWGYGVGANSAVSHPGPTFEVARGSRLNVTFQNDLVRIPNRMPVDTTLDWANPGGLGGLAPVPVVAHLHGSPSQYLSDGLPDAWSTPNEAFKGRLFSKPYTYENQQEAGHLWYHDHARGITRTNVYMGLAGHYFIRDDNEDLLRKRNVLPSEPYEVAMVIQDRQFNADGSLFYPSSDPASPDLPSPTHLPEFFGDAILVNGRAWPRMAVEQRKYRFRLLNGSDSRFYALRFQAERPNRKGPSTPAGRPLPILVIGNELGLLNAPFPAYWFSPPDPAAQPRPAPNTPGGGILQGDTLLIAPGERYDIVVDFSQAQVGTRLLLWNGAASPYNGQPADGVDYAAPTPGLSDRVMAFDIVPRKASVPDATVSLGTALRRLASTPPLPQPAVAGVQSRQILLVEGTDRFGRLQTMLGTVGPDPVSQGTFNFQDKVTERPRVGKPEIWEFHNTTADAHPIHMHLVDFRVLDRQPFTGTLGPKTNTDGSAGNTLSQVVLTGRSIPADSWQAGRKDTVVAYPGYVTRVLVNFSRAGEYVYHCHILSHEDHEMMRPYVVSDTIAGQ